MISPRRSMWVSRSSARSMSLPEPSPDGAVERDRIAAENNTKVNNRTISTATVPAQGRSFACSLEVPANLAVQMVIVRAFAEAGNELAEGVLKLTAGTSGGRWGWR